MISLFAGRTYSPQVVRLCVDYLHVSDGLLPQDASIAEKLARARELLSPPVVGGGAAPEVDVYVAMMPRVAYDAEAARVRHVHVTRRREGGDDGIDASFEALQRARRAITDEIAAVTAALGAPPTDEGPYIGRFVGPGERLRGYVGHAARRHLRWRYHESRQAARWTATHHGGIIWEEPAPSTLRAKREHLVDEIVRTVEAAGAAAGPSGPRAWRGGPFLPVGRWTRELTALWNTLKGVW